jgi:Secretion system C-terminal sorting domain
MKNRTLLLGLFFALGHLTAGAQNDCPPARSFASTANDFNNVNHHYEASQTIEASNHVTGTSIITYDAGVYVKLKPHPSTPNSDGFKVKTSGFFKAIIDGCSVSATNPVNAINLRIFPNPNAGNFSVELPEAAEPGMVFRIINLTGQVLQEQQIQTGVTTQAVEANELPAGLYFLQIVSEGKVLAEQKFVKQ